jgi:hypothetical protein
VTPIAITWTEHYPTVSHRAEVTLRKVEDLGKSRSGRSLARFEVLHGDVVIGTIESAEQTLYRKVGRLSNPSGRAVRWSFSLRAPWSDGWSTSGYGYAKREDVLARLCMNAARAGILKGSALAGGAS